MLNQSELGALIMAARDGGSVFRYEGLRAYAVDTDGEDYHRYVAGLPGPTMSRKQPWLDLLRKERARGVHWHRVRLIRPPLSDYERYACEWGYAYNTQAGDECRIIENAHPAHLPEQDFWLIDQERVAVMHYDDEGHYLGAEIDDDPQPWINARDVLWQIAEPFYSWWNRHPEYHRDTQKAA